MAAWQEEPYIGQSVWCDSHKNGIITGVDRANSTVHANHYVYGHRTYELDEFFGCFDERLNQWVIVPF